MASNNTTRSSIHDILNTQYPPRKLDFLISVSSSSQPPESPSQGKTTTKLIVLPDSLPKHQSLFSRVTCIELPARLQLACIGKVLLDSIRSGFVRLTGHAVRPARSVSNQTSNLPLDFYSFTSRCLFGFEARLDAV